MALLYYNPYQFYGSTDYRPDPKNIFAPHPLVLVPPPVQINERIASEFIVKDRSLNELLTIMKTILESRGRIEQVSPWTWILTAVSNLSITSIVININTVLSSTDNSNYLLVQMRRNTSDRTGAHTLIQLIAEETGIKPKTTISELPRLPSLYDVERHYMWNDAMVLDIQHNFISDEDQFNNYFTGLLSLRSLCRDNGPYFFYGIGLELAHKVAKISYSKEPLLQLAATALCVELAKSVIAVILDGSAPPIWEAMSAFEDVSLTICAKGTSIDSLLLREALSLQTVLKMLKK